MKLDKKKILTEALPLTAAPPPSVALINLKYSDSLSLWILLILPSAFCWQLTSPALMEISLLLTAGSFEGRPADAVAGSSAAQSRRTESPHSSESPRSSESPKTPPRKNSVAPGWQTGRDLIVLPHHQKTCGSRVTDEPRRSCSNVYSLGSFRFAKASKNKNLLVTSMNHDRTNEAPVLKRCRKKKKKKAFARGRPSWNIGSGLWQTDRQKGRLTEWQTAKRAH